MQYEKLDKITSAWLSVSDHMSMHTHTRNVMHILKIEQEIARDHRCIDS